MIKTCVVCSVSFIRIQAKDNNTHCVRWDGIFLQKWNIDLIAFYSSKWIRHLHAVSSTNYLFLSTTTMTGSYCEFIFVIWDFRCKLVPVANPYYWLQYVIPSFSVWLGIFLLLRTILSTKLITGESFETTCVLNKQSTWHTKERHSPTVFHTPSRYKNQSIHHGTEASTMLCCSSGIQFPPPLCSLLMTSTTEGNVSGR